VKTSAATTGLIEAITAQMQIALTCFCGSWCVLEFSSQRIMCINAECATAAMTGIAVAAVAAASVDDLTGYASAAACWCPVCCM